MSTTTATPPDVGEAAPLQTESGARRTRSLGRYIALDNEQTREVVSLPRPDGSTLVVDHQLGTLSDGRLVAHLAHDEPACNARIVCDLYLADDERRGRCRAVTPADFNATRHVTPSPSSDHGPRPSGRLQDAAGHIYRTCSLLVRVPFGEPRRELRWTRSRVPGGRDPLDVVTLREVVGNLEAYEPARTLTREALACCPAGTCDRRLREESQRLEDSAIVLNRGLREAVQRERRLGVLTLGEIALRCGRVRSNCPGGSTGETSWVARRIGEMPEGGEQKPCPWVHSDVLALIARDGLGICPREVEL